MIALMWACWPLSDDGLDLLHILALPYADHQDFREEWREAFAAVRRNAADDRADDLRNDVIDGMTVPPGGPDDPFWQGAQWAYGQVREALAVGSDHPRLVATVGQR